MTATIINNGNSYTTNYDLFSRLGIDTEGMKERDYHLDVFPNNTEVTIKKSVTFIKNGYNTKAHLIENKHGLISVISDEGLFIH